MHYYGTRLSDNLSFREPEGYLLCLNVPVARTGTQEYLPEELGISTNSEFRIQNYRLRAGMRMGLFLCTGLKKRYSRRRRLHRLKECR